MTEVLDPEDGGLSSSEAAKWIARFAREQLVNAPSDGAMSLAQQLKEYLQAISDNGSVDTGFGFEECDLWVEYGGESFYINIRRKT
jgi:hypothetical protein